MYHYVRHADEQYKHFKFLHLHDFRKQLDFFQKQYTILHPNELLQSTNDNSLKTGVILTFDDGLKDHYVYVLPELKSRGLSGVFYISTGIYQTGKILDVHRMHLLLGRFGGDIILEYLRDEVTDDMLSHAHVEEFKRLPYSMHYTNESTKLVKKMMNYFISYDYREDVIDKMMLYFFKDEAQLITEFYMTQDEISQMQNEGMIIGSHTKTHPVLSKMNEQEQRTEISDSFAYLDGVTGGLLYRTFCYPYGGFHSFTNKTEEILKKENCKYSFNVESRDITIHDLQTRPQALPRFDCNEFPFGKCYEYLLDIK